MKRIWFYPIFLITTTVLIFLWIFFSASALTVVWARQLADTTPVPPQGMYIIVLSDEPFANIRMGPSSTIYPKVGILYPGDTAPALGRSPGGDWIQIEYPGAPYDKGWIYSPLVQLAPAGGTLLVVEPPPTPQPPATSTIDPTLAAQFVIIPTATRLPTFTPPPSLVVPNYAQPSSEKPKDTVPLAIIIVAFAVLGVLGFLFSLFLRR